MSVVQVEGTKFKLSSQFLERYKTTKPPFGFNGLGELVCMRTYSRIKPDGANEVWWETVQRVVEGCYNMQRWWILQNGLHWNPWKAQKSAQEMYDRIFNMKFLPPGRGLWAMGSPLTEERGNAACLLNCAFVSTDSIGEEDPTEPFVFLMDASMLGIGVGFDTLGAGKVVIQEPGAEKSTFVIPDSREGWVAATGKLLISYFVPDQPALEFDYSEIRPMGEPIKGFGGVASGPAPLQHLHENIRRQFDGRGGEPLTSRDIVDVMNYLGACVVAGNIRRCLPEGTLVHTNEGLIPIEHIVVGTQVKTSEGYAEVSEVISQGEQSVMALNTQLGEFRCTPQHQVAILGGIGEYTWVRARDVRPGDRLVFVAGGTEGKPTRLPDWHYDRPTNSTTCRDIVIPELDDEMGWLIGFFHGNGYTRANRKENGFNAYVSATTSTDYPEIAERAAAQLGRFGIEPVVEKRKNEECIVVRVTSKQLAWYLDEHVKQPDTQITVPSWILEATRSVRANFIAGLFDADGCRKTAPTQVVSSVYPAFLHQVQAVLASLGVPSRIRLHRPARGSWKALYHLDLVGERAIRDFEVSVVPYSLKYGEPRPGRIRSQNDYGFPAEWVLESDLKFGTAWAKNTKQMTVATLQRVGGETRGLIPVEVLSTQLDVGIASTYDISVPGAHEFVVQEGLLVHNSAEIAFGQPEDTSYLDLKNYEVNPDREGHGWVSNNSVRGYVGMDYEPIASRITINGEPGLFWEENSRAYSRMKDPPDHKDYRVRGTNPCGEQPLEPFEGCNLVESFPHRHESLEDYKRTLKYAYLYAKTVTLGKTPWEKTNAIMLRNRRIGLSQSGIAQAICRFGIEEYRRWCEEGYQTVQYYDKVYSEWLTIPRSIKTTTVKPSGSVSLLCGATPGMHFPEARTYIRRVRLANHSELIPALREAGYTIEPAFGQEDSTSVVEIPVKVEEDVRIAKEVSMWEQLALAAFIQAHWSDNQVSCTVTFDPETEGPQIAHALEYYQYQLKGISFLPRTETGAYAQMPYEAITEEEYHRRVAALKPLSFQQIHDEEAEVEKYCDGDKCLVSW